MAPFLPFPIIFEGQIITPTNLAFFHEFFQGGKICCYANFSVVLGPNFREKAKVSDGTNCLRGAPLSPVGESQQTIYCWEGKLTVRRIHFKYWETIMISRFHEGFSRFWSNLGYF